jgi:hypothetical protein
MKVTIEMSLDHYDQLSQLCEVSRPEYEILKNALVVRPAKDGQYERTMEIPCQMQDAKLLLGYAFDFCRPAVPEIEKAIRYARDR